MGPVKVRTTAGIWLASIARFLILPWVKSSGLASRILSAMAKPLRDWSLHYGYEPVLLESFVEIPRFTANSYQAANWLRLGQTQGRGKLEQRAAPAPWRWIMPATSM
jgi:Domain of unknown function (DUF4338)